MNPLVGKRPAQWQKPQQPQAAEFYKKGDVIGDDCVIQELVGKGGFGIVYLAYNRQTNRQFALKTFRHEFQTSLTARMEFMKEVLLWVNLDEHPYIVAARWVQEFSGRLFVQMDYIEPDEQGRVSLAQHLAKATGSLGVVQILTWGIQFCLGMEHALSCGLTCHRDIKPGNILITKNGTLKISDFGLAHAAPSTTTGGRGTSAVAGKGAGGFAHTKPREAFPTICGTAGYFAPEVYRGERPNILSDIYSFGLVLWQMAAGSKEPPFISKFSGDMQIFLQKTYQQQMTGRFPLVDATLNPVIERCLCPRAKDRYGSFVELRAALEVLLEARNGTKVEAPKEVEKDADYWAHKSGTLSSLNQYKEAIQCADRALEMDPLSPAAWHNKACAFYGLGKKLEAVECFRRVLTLKPEPVSAWIGLGRALFDLSRREEAIECFERALALDPNSAKVWAQKGHALAGLYKREEAVVCYDRSLELEPLNAGTLMEKAKALGELHRRREAIECYARVLQINPANTVALYQKALLEDTVGKIVDAIASYRRFLQMVPPRNTPQTFHARQRLEQLTAT